MKLYIKELYKPKIELGLRRTFPKIGSIGGYQYASSLYVLPEITLNIESYSITPTPRVLKAVWTVDVT